MPPSAIRISLFTDTLGDVNGVSRFIRDIAGAASETGRDLRIYTSTRFSVPSRKNVRNFAPVAARPMPGYDHLELAVPPVATMLRDVRRAQPDAIHISTPGPVGLVGLAAARLLRIPVLGVYHTDFPAYVDHLFADEALTWIARLAMRGVYSRFVRIFTRSHEYARRLEVMGIAGSRLVRLAPGIDTSAFGPRFDRRSDPAFWSGLGLPPEAMTAPKVLYAGRISVEKDLPVLARAWKRVRAGGLLKTGAWAGLPRLIVVGDGPYRAAMEAELAGLGAHFPGFRHREELAAIYASCDLFAFPSTTDTLGQVVMEAQCSGLPVLVSDRGGPSEVVEDGISGRVLSAGQVDLWAEAIRDLLADVEMRKRMGRSAHEAMSAMTFMRSFEHFWQEHEQVVAGSRAGALQPA